MKRAYTDEHASAGVGELQRDLAADPDAAASDECSLVNKKSGHGNVPSARRACVTGGTYFMPLIATPLTR